MIYITRTELSSLWPFFESVCVWIGNLCMDRQSVYSDLNIKTAGILSPYLSSKF